MDVRSQLPIYPSPPAEYSRVFMSDLVGALNRLNLILQNPGVGRQSTMTFTNLPTNDYGLEPGGLFEVGGVLRVALLNRPYPAGLSATGSVGTVAVTT